MTGLRPLQSYSCQPPPPPPLKDGSYMDVSPRDIFQKLPSRSHSSVGRDDLKLHHENPYSWMSVPRFRNSWKAVGCLGATQHNISTGRFWTWNLRGQLNTWPPLGKRLRAQREPQARGSAKFGVLPNFAGGEGRGCWLICTVMETVKGMLFRLALNLLSTPGASLADWH
jgi:hypothetical protein